MKKLTLTIILAFVLSISAFAQTPKVFIAPMENNFNTFLAAALIKNQVPVTITTDETQADYIISGGAVKGQNKWYDTVFGSEKDRNQGSIQLLRVSDKSVAWAGAAGDKSVCLVVLNVADKKK